MATALHNLSDYNPNILPPKHVLSKQRYAIVVADWNSDVTYSLLRGAVETLLNAGVLDENIEVIHVPGTVELTYAAARYVNQVVIGSSDISHRSDTQIACKIVDAVIVIGCVIKGDTPHFDYVCQSVTVGVAELNAKGKIPVIFSVLTTLNQQQALDRAGGSLGNKGVEGAYTAIRMANLTKKNN